MTEDNKVSIYEIEVGERGYDIVAMQWVRDFHDKFYVTRLPDDLIDEILEHQEELFQGDFQEKLAGNIKNESRVIADHPLLPKITEEIFKHVKQAYLTMGVEIAEIFLHKDDEEDNVDLWINRMKKHEFNPLHKHAGVWSFVFYLDIPEEIRQEHLDSKSNMPVPGLIQFVSRKDTEESIMFNPRKGDFIMFLSKQAHTVYPFSSDATRISVAGNVKKVINTKGGVVYEPEYA